MAKVLMLMMQPGECKKFHMEYEQDGKLYQSFPRFGAKTGRQNIEYHLQIPMSNDDYVYRMTPGTEITLHNVAIHRGTSHPEGIRGFSPLHWDASSDFLPFFEFCPSLVPMRPTKYITRGLLQWLGQSCRCAYRTSELFSPEGKSLNVGDVQIEEIDG